MLSHHLNDLCNELSLKLKKYGDDYIGPCGIHGGDCSNSLKIFIGHTIPTWSCWTRHCENTFTKTLIGLVRAAISRDKYNWTDTKKIAPFNEAIDFCCKFLGIKFNEINPDNYTQEKDDFVRSVNRLNKPKKDNKYICHKSYLGKSLKCPAQYFIDKGFSPEILKDYCIGYCGDKNKEMFNRVVCPVFDDNSQYVMTAVARSIYEDCPKCKEYHNPKTGCLKYPKWKHLFNTEPSNYLYNYWNARKHIEKMNTAILVEGVGDVLKMVQCGIYNVVGLFGNRLKDPQKIILEKNPIYNLVLLLDNDKSGELGMNKIIDDLKYLYRIKRVNWQGVNHKDVGSMTEEQIKNQIISQF